MDWTTERLPFTTGTSRTQKSRDDLSLTRTFVLSTNCRLMMVHCSTMNHQCWVSGVGGGNSKFPGEVFCRFPFGGDPNSSSFYRGIQCSVGVRLPCPEDYSGKVVLCHNFGYLTSDWSVILTTYPWGFEGVKFPDGIEGLSRRGFREKKWQQRW